MILTISCDIEPLTMNMAYPTGKNGRRYLSQEGKCFKEYIYHQTRNHLMKSEGFPACDTGDFFTSMELFFYSPKFLTKTGKISKNKPDTTNCIKLVEDAVFEAIGLDDYLNIDIDGVRFRYSKTPKIVIILRVHDIRRLKYQN